MAVVVLVVIVAVILETVIRVNEASSAIAVRALVAVRYYRTYIHSFSRHLPPH